MAGMIVTVIIVRMVMVCAADVRIAVHVGKDTELREECQEHGPHADGDPRKAASECERRCPGRVHDFRNVAPVSRDVKRYSHSLDRRQASVERERAFIKA